MMKIDLIYRNKLFPILILLLGLGITFVLSYTSLRDNYEINRQSSERIFQDFEKKLQIQLKATTLVLYNSAAFILSSDTITRKEWQEFQFLNKSYNELPGIQGIGYSILIPEKKLESFEQQICKDGFPDFKVFPTGKRDYYTSVLYIEPLTERNKLALGFDGYSEPVRQKAMALSRDSDVAVISGKLYLVTEQQTDQSSGAIIFVPVYKFGAPKQSPEERRSAIIGWVFTSFRMNDLVKSVLGDWDVQKIRLRIFDDQLLIPEKLMFDSDSVFHLSRSESPNNEWRIPLNFNNKTWTLQFNNYDQAVNQIPIAVIRIFLGGLIISLLLFILANNLIAARAKTHHIQELNEELRKVNINKDRFISVLAHDLKSPFNSLLGFSELLAENMHEFDAHEIENYIKLIHTSANVAHNLLDELLLWARIQTDHFPSKPEKLNLTEICKNQIEDHALIAGKKNISVLVNPSIDVFVLADEMMLKVILRNLLVNAIKYTHEGGIIRVSISSKGNWVTVTVRDNGIGMSPEELSNLFNGSHSLSKPGTANEKGTGLGLLLCKEMVNKNGGRIWAESTLGQGSQFCFTLPVA
jgi:signal transduction histidine kinase